jgi:glycosyltransferase involved in cell wall biosynthesis
MLIRDMVRAKSRFFKTAWINLVERRSLARASAVHVTADMERIELQALGLPVPNPIDIPNGIEIPTQYPPLTAGPFASLPARYVLFLSRISWKKGLDRLIRAWQHVADIPLVIAGNDDEDFRPRLEALAREAGVAERIIFIGGVSDAQKWALYAGAQLFVLPSYSENFGNVVTEAMAMRCPVILTREVGIAPLVESSGAGRVVGGSPEELARVVNELLGDPSLRERMGSRGADVVRQRLSWNALALRAESLYMGILGRKNSLAIDAIV